MTSKKLFCVRRARWWAPLVFVLVAAPCLMAAETPQLLSTDRWQERSQGVSLLPPLGARLIELPADDALLRIVEPTGQYTINLYIKRSTSQLDINRIQQSAIEQIFPLQTDARLLNEPKPGMTVNRRPATLLFFHLPNRLGGKTKVFNKGEPGKPWVLGQGFVQINPQTFVLLQIETDADRFDAVRPIFEAMFNSIEFEDPAKLAKQRLEWATAGDAWHRGVTSDLIKTVLFGEQYFRLVNDKTDAGFMRITCKAGEKAMDVVGTRIDVYARVQTGDQLIETTSNFFLSDDGKSEIWTIITKTTGLSKENAKPGVQAPKVWTEAGLRSGDNITINRKSPVDSKEFKALRPVSTPDAPRAYVSQVELFLIDRIIDHRKPREIGFYAYSPNAGKITYRTERVVVDAGGLCKVYSRPVPEGPEQVSHFDASGNLTKRVLSDGSMWLPASKAEVAARWPGA